MNDTISSARAEGTILLDDENIYDPEVDVVELRRRVGMVFQRPNPFPQSIYDNVAYAPRRAGVFDHHELDALVEKCLRQAVLWDDVKDRMRTLLSDPFFAYQTHRFSDFQKSFLPR